MDPLPTDHDASAASAGSLVGLDEALDRMRPQKTAEIVARRLAELIIRNGLDAGARLPPEKEMLSLLGVGRGTLREALRLLESHGVISMRTGPKGGPIVRRPQARDLSNTLMLFLQFQGATLADIFAARVAVEPSVTALAAAHASEPQLAEIQGTVRALREEPTDSLAFRTHNEAFHTLVDQASGNPVLLLFNDALRALAATVMSGVDYDEETVEAGIVAHQRIIDALMVRDAATARHWALSHLLEIQGLLLRTHSDLMDRPISWA